MKKIGQTKQYKRRFVEDDLVKEEKLFTKKELQAFGEFTREEGKAQRDKEELEFLQNMKIALLILGDEELEGMEDAQIMVLRRIKKIKELLSSIDNLGVEE